MASRWFPPLGILGIGRVEIAGRFFPNGAQSTGTLMAIKGKGFTAKYTATTGIFLLTFEDKFVDFMGFYGTPQNAATEDWTVLGSTYDASASTILVHTRRAGSLDVMSAGANNSISFRCLFSNSSVNY